MSNIAKIVRQLREEAGLTPTDLHKKSGLSLAYISKLESGEYNKLAIKLQTARALAVGLSLPLRDFLERIGFLTPEADTRPSTILLKSALRSSGRLSDEQAEKVLEYVEFIRNSPGSRKV